jgi:hypothetical protein
MATPREFLASALIMIFAGEVCAQSCPDSPGPDQVIVYQHRAFGGKCKTMGIGRYPNPSFFSPVPNDSISSLKVGSNVRVHVFERRNFNGQVALFEGGSSHDAAFPNASPFSLGPNVNDTASSIIVQEASGVRVPYIFVNDYPRDRETVWSEEAQGMCHTDTHWFITDNPVRLVGPQHLDKVVDPTLRKIPLSADLKGHDPSVAIANIPGSLKDHYVHMGDPDCISDFVFVPLEADDGRDPVVAVYRASDLQFINYGILYANDGHAGWVAIDPTNGIELWTSKVNLSRTGAQGVLIYTIDWSQVASNGVPGEVVNSPEPAPKLLNRKGEQLWIKDMQGGVFDTTGEVLYLSNSDDSSADGHGIFAFLKSTGEWIGQTTVDYGLFRYETGCCGQEEEGLDFFPTNPSITPGISGELHAILLNNEVFDSDRIWMKHYTQFQSATPDLVPLSPPGSVQFCKRVDGQLQVAIRVENQGGAFAPASITTVDFFSFGSADIPTVGIPGGRFIDLAPIKPPAGCFQRDCVFKITVDSLNSVNESNYGNNSGTGVCVG